MTGTCTFERCADALYCRGYCVRHYHKLRKNGELITKKYAPAGKGAAERMKYVREYLLEHGCMDCGYDKDHRALSFDHRPGTVKVRDIKAGRTLGWHALLAEIAKCDVVCMNCHVIRTSERRKGVMSVDTPQSALSQNGR